MKINSIPSNKPSESVSGLLGSAVNPVRFICSEVRNEPNELADSAESQGLGRYSPPKYNK